MTHYKMLDRVPSVVITSNKNELKIYQGNEVYLNNGDNFELRLFNPTKFKVGVEIIFNGIKKGDSYLVLNPGQDVTLDRFIDEQRKMIFETYTIDGNNREAIEAAQQNGLITFNFYKEYYRSNFTNCDDDVNINYNFPPNPKKNDSFSQFSKSININKSNCSIYNSSVFNGNNYPAGVISTNNVNFSDNVYLDYNVDYNTYNITNIKANSTSSTTNPITYNTSYANNISSNTSIDRIETGRVEMGEISNQQLRQVNAQFQNDVFHTISYKMLPHSAKNQNINEIRHYCGNCGYRLRKQSWSFCPKCGSKIA